jgi:hypothetical protein
MAKLSAVSLESAMKAVVVTEHHAGTAKIITVTKLTAMAEVVAANANANAEVVSGSYGRCRNGNGCEGCERKT